MTKSTKDEQRGHKHLCPRCNNQFECDDAEDADLEFSICPDCKEKSKRRRRETIPNNGEND